MAAIKAPEHTREQFMELFSYDALTGHFMCLVDDSKWGNSPLSRRGKRSGTVVGNGYRMLCVKGKRYTEHRVAWFIHYGVWPQALDHINGDKTDNRIANLREATTAENGWNTTRRRNNTSGYKGVSFSSPSGKGSGWRAEIRFNGTRVFLGDGFATAEAARDAYKEAAAQFHGDFARTE